MLVTLTMTSNHGQSMSNLNCCILQILSTQIP